MKRIIVVCAVFIGVVFLMTTPTSASAAGKIEVANEEALCSFTLLPPFPSTLDAFIATAAIECPGFPLNYTTFGLEAKQGKYTILVIESNHQIWYHIPKVLLGYASTTEPIVVTIDQKDDVEDVIATMMVETDPWKGFTVFDCSYLWIITTSGGYWRIDGNDKEWCASQIGK